jgi:hypothetical protein
MMDRVARIHRWVDGRPALLGPEVKARLSARARAGQSAVSWGNKEPPRDEAGRLIVKCGRGFRDC